MDKRTVFYTRKNIFLKIGKKFEKGLAILKNVCYNT